VSLKTLNAFKWDTLAISFYHPAGAKPGSEEGSCVSSFTGTNPGRSAAVRAISLFGTGLSMIQQPIWDVTDSIL
jgi:hypothetical protein